MAGLFFVSLFFELILLFMYSLYINYSFLDEVSAAVEWSDVLDGAIDPAVIYCFVMDSDESVLGADLYDDGGLVWSCSKCGGVTLNLLGSSGEV